MAEVKQPVWQQYAVVALGLLLVIAFSGWYYHESYYLDAKNVFWGTMDRNLQTASVTKTVSSSTESQDLTQVTRLQFKGQLASYTTVTLKDNTPDNQSSIVSETIGTTNADYLKYDQITSSAFQPPQAALGVWATNQASDTQAVDVYVGDLLATPILFGYLNHDNRAALIKQMKDNQVFEVDFSKIDTQAEIANKRVYSYDIVLNLPAYLAVYQTYLNMIGQTELAAQISPPEDVGTINMTVFIDPNKRQIVEATIADSGFSETYSNYDLSSQIDIPQNVGLSINDLQQLLMGL